ncbi:hypothetical protein [Streptomyces sp. NPDC056401]|uniref:hypothetical protein n=1 Tax=Streptomyces sp. NPDC056401 TaxID=3345809 RepID=UPI0035DAB48E
MKQTKPRKAPAKPLTRDKFRNILRAVASAKQNGRSMDQVAERQGVSVETVRAVRRTGTWVEFVRYKKSLRAKKNGADAPAKVTPEEVAQAAQAEETKPETPTVTREEFLALQKTVNELRASHKDLTYSINRNSADLERLSSWVKAIDTRLSNLKGRALTWPWGRR